MKIGFWNVNMGTTSFGTRLATFQKWCAEIQPELLVLEEVGNTMLERIKTIQTWSGMTYVGHVETLNWTSDPTTKNIVALERTGTAYDFQARALKFPGLEQKRNLLKVTSAQIVPTLDLWGIHANASRMGGTEAVRCVAEFLGTPAGAATVVGGDFNLPYALAGGALKALSKNWQGNNLTFTQWNTRGDSIPSAASLAINTPPTKTIKTNAILDYVMYGPQRTVQQRRNCKTEPIWRDILMQFDHCPVVYEIT
jgi:endonuclease/exonuclease/phosphatase family metal-dependent hydrolase